MPVKNAIRRTDTLFDEMSKVEDPAVATEPDTGPARDTRLPPRALAPAQTHNSRHRVRRGSGAKQNNSLH